MSWQDYKRQRESTPSSWQGYKKKRLEEQQNINLPSASTEQTILPTVKPEMPKYDIMAFNAKRQQEQQLNLPTTDQTLADLAPTRVASRQNKDIVSSILNPELIKNDDLISKTVAKNIENKMQAKTVLPEKPTRENTVKNFSKDEIEQINLNMLKEKQPEEARRYQEMLNQRVTQMTPKQVLSSASGIAGNILMGAEGNLPATIEYFNTLEQQSMRDRLSNDIAASAINRQAEQEGQYRTVFSFLNDKVNSDELKQWRKETIQNNIDKAYGTINKYLAEQSVSIGSNLGNMAISSINPALGSLSFMLSAAGNYLEDAKERGMDDKSAIGYASLMGIVEGGTEAVISGNILKSGAKLFGVNGVAKESLDKVINSFGFDMLENALQEGITEPLNELVAQFVAGEEYANWDNIVQRSFKSAFDGAVSSIILGGASVGINSCRNIYEKSQKNQKVSTEEIKKAIQDAKNNGIDVNGILSQNIQNITNEVKAEMQQVNINKGSQSNISDFNNQVEQTTQEYINQAQNEAREQTSTITQNLMKSIDDYNNSRQEEQEIFDINNEETRKEIETIQKIAEDRGINIQFDENRFSDNTQNAFYEYDKNGNVANIVLNPNTSSRKYVQDLVVHELVHSFSGNQKTNLMKDVLNYAKTLEGYDKAYQDIRQSYEKVYGKNVSEDVINEEVVANILGQKLGSKEFINDLVNGKYATQNRNWVQKIYDFVKNQINRFKGYKDQERYWTHIKEMFDDAYRNSEINKGNQKFSFGGESAKTANVSTLKQAQKLKKQGLSNEEIYQQTGWFEGNEGKWRFEIDNSKNDITLDIKEVEDYYRKGGYSNDYAKKITDVLKADELYEAYPKLKDIVVEVDMYPDDKNTLAYVEYRTDSKGNPKPSNIIYVTPKGLESLKTGTDEFKSILLHELQHHIQQEEGFSRGASPEEWLSNKRDNILKRLKSITQEYISKELKENNAEHIWDIKDSTIRGDLYKMEYLAENSMNKYAKDPEDFELNYVQKRGLETTLGEEKTKEFYNILDEMKDYRTWDKSFAYYRNTAGEIEAREVQNRRNMTPEERKAKLPFIKDENTVYAETGTGNYVEKVTSKENTTDSQGRKLSKEQVEYFKDSKVRDEDGNLLTMYHGTGSDFNVFDMAKIGRNSGDNVKGIWLTSNENYASGYASRKMIEAYVNIKNPLNELTVTMKLSDLQKAVSEFAKDYDAEVINKPNVIEKIYNKENASDYSIYDTITKAIANDKQKYFNQYLEKYTNKDGMFWQRGDGDYLAIAFNSNQIKNVDNLNPTENKDIRFSIDTRNDGTLLALHNLTEDKLRGVLELGGFPVPSIAITNQPHTQFGDISVVFDKNTIDPANIDNEVYDRDVWSPTFPRVDYDISNSDIKKYVSKDLDLYSKDDIINRAVINYFYDTNLLDKIDSRGIEGTLESIKNSKEMKYLYLNKVANQEFTPIMKQAEFSRSNDYGNIELQKFLDWYKGTPLNELSFDEKMALGEKISEIVKEKTEADLEKSFNNSDLTSTIKDSIKKFSLQIADSYKENFGKIDNFIYSAISMQRNGADYQVIDEEKTLDKADTIINQKEYEQWVDSTFGELFKNTKKGIRNKKDAYTSSGNRRSFNQLHDDYNLSNIVKAMVAERTTGVDNFSVSGFGTIQAKRAKQFDSIQDIKNNEELLTSSELTPDILEPLKDDIVEDIEILSKYYNSSGYSSGFDNAANAISEFAGKKNLTPEAFKKVLKTYYNFDIDSIPEDFIREVIRDLHSLENIQTDYFEAKPQRAVGLDEVKAMVIPNDMNTELKQQLQDMGIRLVEYDRNIEGDREAKLKSAELQDLRFSKDTSGDWDNFLEKNFKKEGTGTSIKDMKVLPAKQITMQDFEDAINEYNFPTKDANDLKNDLKYIEMNKQSLDEFKDFLRTYNEAYQETLQSKEDEVLDTTKTYSTGRKEIYRNYLNDNSKYDRTALERAKEIIPGKQGRRTKEQWLNIAKQIGTEIANKSNEEIEKIAYRSWLDEAPNQKSQLNRQGQKFVKFNSDDWINAIYNQVKDVRQQFSVETEDDSWSIEQINEDNLQRTNALKEAYKELQKIYKQSKDKSFLQDQYDKFDNLEEKTNNDYERLKYRTITDDIQGVILGRKSILDFEETQDFLKDLKEENLPTQLPTAEQTEQSLPIKEEPNIPVAEQTTEENLLEKGKSRKHYETYSEAESLSTKDRNEAKKLYKQEQYVPVGNLETLTNANSRIERNGLDNEYTAMNVKFNNNEKMTLDDIVTMERMIQMYSAQGDSAKVNNLMQNVAIMGTELGQEVQALSIIKKMSPEGQLQLLNKLIERTNQKENSNLKITDEQADRILKSNGEKELNDNITQVVEEIAQDLDVTFGDEIRAWRYLSMLGNPRTHIRNLLGNVAMNVLQNTKNKLAGAGEDLASLINPNLERTKTLKLANKDQRDFAKADAFLMEDMIDGGGKYDMKNILQEAKRTSKSKVLNATEKFNSNLLDKEDKIFLRKAYEQAMRGYMAANKLSSKDMQDSATLEKARKYATLQAQEATFHQYSALASRLSQLERDGGTIGFLTSAVLPFKKTPINIAKTGIEYSPIGIISSVGNTIKNVNKDTKTLRTQLQNGKITQEQYNSEISSMVNKRIDQMSKGLTGTSLALLGYVLAKQGVLKAGNGDDEDEFEEKLGKQTYSITIGDNNFSLDWLAPSAIPLFVGANFSYLANGDENSTDNETMYDRLGKSLNTSVTSLSQAFEPMTEMSMLQGLASTLSSYEQDSSNKIFDLLSSSGQSYAGQFIPTALGQVAKTIDPTVRDTTSTKKGMAKKVDQFINQAKSKIPGLSYTLPAKTNVWGEEKTRPENNIVRLLENAVLPYNREKLIEDTTSQKLEEVYEETGTKGVLPSTPQKYITLNSQRYNLNNEDFNKSKKVYGQTAKTMLDKMIDTKDFTDLSSENKAKVIGDIYLYAKEEFKLDYAARHDINYTAKVRNSNKKYAIFKDYENGNISLKNIIDQYYKED